MLDHTSRKMLKYLQDENHNPQGYMMFVDFYDAYGEYSGLSDQEMMACIRNLEECGYIKFAANQYGTRVGFELNHKARHQKELSLLAAAEYLKNNWIAIVALIVSIIALSKSL